MNSPVLNSRREELAELAIKSRLPTAYGQGEYVQAGGLMSYGPNIVELFRRTATYVDKILKEQSHPNYRSNSRQRLNS
jgi:putative ABC transport system substrate-binding protein